MTRWLRVRWRLDRPAALMLALVASPLLAGLWVTVRLQDGRPSLVRLERVGRFGQSFAMAKFRSMKVAAANGHSGGPALTSGADPRVTRLGQRLRHYRLDELPQLTNVVRGEMSLIGPRPEAPAYVDLEDRRWQTVLTALPGIAGPTQVLIQDFEAGMGFDDHHGYEAEILPVKLAIDIWYLEHASPIVDLLVIWALFERFVLRRRVTFLHTTVAAEVPEVADLFARHAGEDDPWPAAILGR